MNDLIILFVWLPALLLIVLLMRFICFCAGRNNKNSLKDEGTSEGSVSYRRSTSTTSDRVTFSSVAHRISMSFLDQPLIRFEPVTMEEQPLLVGVDKRVPTRTATIDIGTSTDHVVADTPSTDHVVADTPPLYPTLPTYYDEGRKDSAVVAISVPTQTDRDNNLSENRPGTVGEGSGGGGIEENRSSIDYGWNVT